MYKLYINQLSKFGTIGIFNTLIDLGVLNILMLISGISFGLTFSMFKLISFFAANLFSYAGNKFWTFNNKKNISFKNYSKFFFVSAAGAVINIGIASIIVNLIPPFSNISSIAWANIGSAVAILASATWNFTLYKHYIFKLQNIS